MIYYFYLLFTSLYVREKNAFRNILQNIEVFFSRACFKKLPRILCFNTMRYTFNMLTMLKEKVNTHFSFPMRLDMSGYVEKHLMPAQYQGTFLRNLLKSIPSYNCCNPIARPSGESVRQRPGSRSVPIWVSSGGVLSSSF